MNYYKQIAEMLGLELGQEFRIIDSHERTIDDALFEITEDGLFSKANNLSGKVTLMLDLILSGKCKAVPKQWKPKKGEAYWHYSKWWEQLFASGKEPLMICVHGSVEAVLEPRKKQTPKARKSWNSFRRSTRKHD